MRISLSVLTQVATRTVLLSAVALPTLVFADETYDVGIGVVNITPDYPIRLNGFGNRRDEPEGVSQQIYARSIAISQGDSPPLVLVVLDSLGIRTPMVDAAAKQLADSHQLPRSNLAVTFSHSHCTPKVNGACDNIFSSAIPGDHQQHIDRYTKELTDHIATAAAAALDSRKPSTLAWAVGEVKFAKNRRDVGGPVDHDLPMLVIKDSETGKPRAIYVSYACHAVTLSFNQISGDWPGYAAAMIERQVPGVTAMVSIGAGSDQNPLGGVTGDKVDVAAQQGVEIATEVKRLLEGELRSITGQPSSVLNEIVLPLNPLPTREQLVEQTGKGRPTDMYNATTQLARLDRGEELISQVDYPIQTWTFGDSFCMTFLAGEVCVDYALRLKTEIDRDRFWLNTYSNDFCSYIPSERLAREGRYGGGAEVPYFALPATLKAGLETLIVDEVHRQVPDVFKPSERTQGVPPKAPEDSLQCIQTHENLKVTLAAAEPNLSDPVAIDFGTDGRLWVAEMNDYGRGVYETFAQTGRVRWLKDTDNDGRFETVGTFVDGLRFPTDVKVWRDGILICDAPDILFARDPDGDGRAESVEKLFSGFEVRNAQARVNSLRFGLDNWVYGACGLFGGNILSHKTGLTVDCSNRDFRINPDTGEIQTVSGRTQQGRCRNDRGDWFGCSNGTLVRAIPSDDQYAARNTVIKLASPQNLMTDAGSYQLIPPKNLVTFELSGAPGKATSACGLGIYRDVALGPSYHNDTFTCEPVHQSVHRIDVMESGHGFTGQRGPDEDDREFLSSTDRWFRPVQARTGPDGALWIVDMYRYVIEHPRWIPQATLAELDVNAGTGRGRIYRVTPKHANQSERPLIPNLEALSNPELVAQLDSSNGVVRDLAHQMLLWRNADDVVSDLQKLVANGQTDFGMIHALSVLDGPGGEALSAHILQTALRCGHPEVQRFAVQLSERFLDNAELMESVLILAGSDNVRLRRQVALSLGESEQRAGEGTAALPDSQASTIARLISQNEPDSYVRSAALNSITTKTIAEVLKQFKSLPTDDQGKGTFHSLVLMAANIADADTVNEFLLEVVPSAEVPTGTNADLWVKLLNALDLRSKRSAVHGSDAVLDAIWQMHQFAAQAVSDDDATAAEVTAAVKLLGRRYGSFTNAALSYKENVVSFPADQRAMMLSGLLSARRASDVQQSAVAAVIATGSENATDLLLEAFPAVGSDAKSGIVDALLNQKDGPLRLLKEIENGTVRPEFLDAARRERLLNSSAKQVQSLAQKVLGAERKTDRSALVADMQSCLELAGDVERGQSVFRKRCSSCHRLQDHGFVVGPDLQALTNRDPKWLLTTILDPNKEVDARYIAWTAATVDGRTASGMIVEETGTTVRLRESGGKEHVIARSDIEEFRSSQKSVMPEGLERDMTAQDFRDVIAYVASLTTSRNTAASASAEQQLPRHPPQIAPFLLDENQPVERRQKVIDQRPGMGPGIISLLAADIPSDDIEEEYRRIPWIWRVAIAVGKRNDGGEIRDVLEVSVPTGDQPLRDWQAVVIGGGLINGAGQLGLWPSTRMNEILEGLPHVKAAWPRMLELSAKMADDTAVKPGTRYDALRMVALQNPATAIPHLQRYLAKDTPTSLQMGAVSGLADIDSPEATALLIHSLEFLSGRNRELAIEALLRSDVRAATLSKEISAGKLSLTSEEQTSLRQHPVQAIRHRAKQL